jgi:hypothetical protein
MAFCTVFQFEVPDSFPLVAWEAFYADGRKATDGQSEAQGEFIRAMGCVIYRYNTCKEAVDSMIQYWHVSGKALTFDGYYTMQRDLFSFFTCGLSSIESLLYGIYVVVCQQHSTVLPWSDLKARRKKADPDRILGTLALAYPSGHPVCTEIASLIGSQEWKDWNAYRNTMVHRSLPSRVIAASIGGPPPPNEMVTYAESWSNPALRADESQMEAKLDWLAAYVEKVATAAADL